MSDPIARLTETASGRVHLLGLGRHVLGREEDADVKLDHADVSRRHVELELSPTSAVVRDLDSKNGISVDGHKLERGPLPHGAVLRLGELELRFEFQAARLDALLVRSGEITLRRPRPEPSDADAAQAQTSLLLPGLAALLFATLLVSLLVFG